MSGSVRFREKRRTISTTQRMISARAATKAKIAATMLRSMAFTGASTSDSGMCTQNFQFALETGV